MDIEKNVLDFFAKSILGKDVDLGNKEFVIIACISKAYDDMLTGGRFFGISNKQDNIKKIYDTISQNNFKFSTDLIKKVQTAIFDDKEKMCNGKNGHEATCFGLTQKVVNMTFKYFYCFAYYINENIDFTNCDCPMDSFIINEAYDKNLIKNKPKWTKLNEDEYNKFQVALDSWKCNYLQEKCSKRLQFDFNW